MEERLKNDIRDVAAALEANVPTAFQEKFKRIVSALEEAKAKHVKITVAVTPGDVERMIEAYFGPLLDAGDEMSRGVFLDKGATEAAAAWSSHRGMDDQENPVRDRSFYG